tara:strand:+ start:131 stop:268 length:138 start_codon:yes stop_codon:yes gene_type:complete
MQREQQRINRTATANKIIIEQQRQGMGGHFGTAHAQTHGATLYIY